MGRRLLAEFTGTGLLVTVVVGSGIAATRLTSDGALRLLVSAVVTALGLAVLILVFAPASGAHFNPLVTAADWLAARRTSRRYGPGLAVAVTGCQVAGAIGGTALANAMFAVPLLAASPTRRGGGPVLLGEVGHRRAATADRDPGADQPDAARGLVGRGVDRRGVLVHLVHFLCQPGRHPRPDPHPHLCRDRPGLGPGVHRRRDRRQRARRAAGRGRAPGPARPGARSAAGPADLDWDLPDPAGLSVDQIRPIRDGISTRVRALIDKLDD